MALSFQEPVNGGSLPPIDKSHLRPWVTLNSVAQFRPHVCSVNRQQQHSFTQYPLTMNTSLSLLTALFLSIASTTAFASPNATANLNQEQTTDVQMDQTREGEVTLQVMAVTPGGSTKRIQSRHRNMNNALGAYQRFVSTLPYGSRIVRVAFLGSNGQIIFSHQG